jgi:hypothetical protein
MDRFSDRNLSSDHDNYDYDYREIADLFWGIKVTRCYVDRITFAEKRDVVGYPRIEDSSCETTDFAFSQPRIPLLPTPPNHGDRQQKGKTSTTSGSKKNGSTSSNGSRKSTTPSPQPQRRSVSLPGNQRASRSRQTSKSPARPSSSRTKKSPTPNQKPKTSSDTKLGAFLHRNTVEQIIKQEAAKVLMGKTAGLDHKSIGSCRSMASMSVSDRSYAERSKAEESLARQAKERRTAKSRKKVAGKLNGPLYQVGHGMAITSINEMSITDFSGHLCTSKSTPTNPSPVKSSKKNASLDGFLSKQDAIAESTNDGKKHDRNAADAASIVSASTLGSKSVSARSKAEQSGSEKKMRRRKKFAMGETLTEEDDEDTDENDQRVNSSGINGFVQEKTEKGNISLDDSLDLKDAVVPRVEKNLRFRDGHSEKYISQEITHSMYDDLFYTSEELAEFRYEAFMEEAGLDINEFS